MTTRRQRSEEYRRQKAEAPKVSSLIYTLDDAKEQVKDLENRLATAEIERGKLAIFARHTIRTECWDCWDCQPGIDGGDVQDMAHKLGLIEPYTATEADAAVMDNVSAGDTIYKFADWLAQKDGDGTQENPNG
jgi:hypothetical protein